jgi:hypothetical protein
MTVDPIDDAAAILHSYPSLCTAQGFDRSKPIVHGE